MSELDKTYDAKAVESRTYQYWMDNHHFRATPDPNKEPFTIVIPPPNITGSLHMGHALDNTIQDVLIRYNRMLGKVACWVPGTDHAGIATQTVVEKQLKKEGKTRHDVGRPEFLKLVWKWKEQYGSTIVEQLKRLGVSCDWEREAFTMDAARSKAVREVFVRLFEKGDIYRGKRLINWCPHCLTALSDLEVEHEEAQGSLYYLNYGNGVTIATTRPETIFADVAVAVNPTDERFKHLIGQKCKIPLANREIPIIGDEAVLTDFGTGALKITPAHDPTDFEIGQRHNLEQLVCLSETGKLNELTGEFNGMDRFKARVAVTEKLEAEGLLVKKEEHLNKVGHCYRCHTVIEPYLSDQWFMNMKRLAEPAIAAVKNGDIRFVPERYSKTYLAWMENIRDWCISRQIWWGHRIPVWTCENCNHRQGYTQDPSGPCPKCGDARYEQDPDVLDTWFSSGLWPFSVFGWPDQTPDLKYFYPTSTLVTGRDIINLWVARMIMLGYEFLGQKPYSDVHIHATIMTRDGQRMSKSKGTGIDPLDLIEKYGADGTRFGLMSQATQSQDVRHTEERYEQGRNFCNKIWNAVRLSLSLAKDVEFSSRPEPTSLADRWLLTRVSQLARKVRGAIEGYNFDQAAGALYEFFWTELCDWYLELIKPVFYHRQDAEEQKRVAQCLLYALDHYLRLSHPIMPMITEELWHFLPGERGPLIHAAMPEPGWEDAQAVAEMETLQAVVRAARNLRAELGLLPKQKAELCLVAPAASRALLEQNRPMLEALSMAEPLNIGQDRPGKALSQGVGELEVFLPFPPDFDLSREVKRLEAELAEARKLAEGTERKLANQAFVEKAKPEVVAKERERLADYQERARGAEERLKLFTAS
ncbi:valine--tRNA ligase [bacterium]|nr:valine--tRNA ligase [bacterium]